MTINLLFFILFFFWGIGASIMYISLAKLVLKPLQNLFLCISFALAILGINYLAFYSYGYIFPVIPELFSILEHAVQSVILSTIAMVAFPYLLNGILSIRKKIYLTKVTRFMFFLSSIFLISYSCFVLKNFDQRVELRSATPEVVIEEIINNELTEPDSTEMEITAEITCYDELVQQMAYQESIDSQLASLLLSGDYTMDYPYIKLDPYATSPLTALILFQTPEDTYVSISVMENGSDGAFYTFEELSTSHTIPVYGLYAGTNNFVTYDVYDRNNTLLYSNTIEIETQGLPEVYNSLIINAHTITDGYTDGVTFLYPDGSDYTFAIDQNGDIRWYLTGIDYYKSNDVVDGYFYFPTSDQTYIVKVDKLGKIHELYASPHTVHHDIEVMDNENILVTGSLGETYNDFIYEIDAQTGEVTNTLDLKEVFSRSRISYTPYNDLCSRQSSNWFHNNSIEYIAEDHSVIISGNFQSTVAKISWPEGNIEWILADDYDWLTYYEQFLLSPIGDEFDYMYNQHAAYLLDDLDENPDTLDLLLFDNGASRASVYQDYHGISLDESYSRVVHYRVNESTKEVEQLFEYGKSSGEELFSRIRGDADYLSSGNYLGYFDRYQIVHDVTSTNPVLVEIASNGTVIWETEIYTNSDTGSATSYQCDRLPLYFEYEEEINVY